MKRYLVTAFLIGWFSVASGSLAAEDLSLLPIEQNVVRKTNVARARLGLAPLTIDGQLMQSARFHTGWMARNGRLQHTSQPVAENIAAGQSSSTEAVQDWLNSPGHRANMLNMRYRRIGVAAYRSPNGQVYWCQQFLP